MTDKFMQIFKLELDAIEDDIYMALAYSLLTITNDDDVIEHYHCHNTVIKDTQCWAIKYREPESGAGIPLYLIEEFNLNSFLNIDKYNDNSKINRNSIVVLPDKK